MPPLTSSKLTEAERVTCWFTPAGFGEPEADDAEGPTGLPEYVPVHAPPSADVDPPPGVLYPGTEWNDHEYEPAGYVNVILDPGLADFEFPSNVTPQLEISDERPVSPNA